MVTSRRKIIKLIRQYAKIVGITDTKTIERVFNRGDVHQKKRDLIAMRATIYAKKRLTANSTPEEQQKVLKEFEKTENLKDVHWPKFKIAETQDGLPDRAGSKKTGRLQMRKSNLSIKPKS